MVMSVRVIFGIDPKTVAVPRVSLSNNGTGCDGMPLAITVTEAKSVITCPAGNLNCVVTGVAPVATPVLLQLNVRA